MPNGHTAGAPPREIERIFQVSLYVLLLTGFATLAGTGKLDVLGLLAVSGALMVRGIFLVRGVGWQIPERVASYLGLLYLVVYVIDFYFVSRSFVTASIHLVVFGVIVKLFSIHRDRDLAYLALLEVHGPQVFMHRRVVTDFVERALQFPGRLVQMVLTIMNPAKAVKIRAVLGVEIERLRD